MNNPIQRAFAPFHASEHILEEVVRMTEQKRRHFRTVRRTILVAAAAVAALALTAFAADYVIHGRKVFFFDTIAALTQQHEADYPGYAVAVAVPCTAEEAGEMETSAEYVARMLEHGMFDNEEVLEQSTAGETHRRVAACSSEMYGDIVTEYVSSAEIAERISVDGAIDWDFPALADAMTPEDGGQMLALTRNPDGKLIRVKAHAGYTADDGSRFTLNWTFDPAWDSGTPEYILNDAYDDAEMFTTDDGAEVLLLSYDGQVWVRAGSGARALEIYTNGYTIGEMKALLNELHLSDALSL